MELFSKFIIEGENLILGKCTFHKELKSSPESKVDGGGAYSFDGETRTFVFEGLSHSHDFGRVSFEQIKICVEKGNVFERGMRRNLIKDRDYKYAYKYGNALTLLTTLTP